MTALLAIGAFNEWSRNAMAAEFDVVFAHDVTDALALDANMRSAKLMAFMGHTPIGENEFKLFPNLAVIANFGVGYDAIDVTAAAARGIAVTNTPDVLSDDVADQTVLMMLSWCRKSHEAERWMRDGLWDRSGSFALQTRMSGKRVGIVGLGRIGRIIAQRLDAFDMKISYTSRAPKSDVPSQWSFFESPLAMAPHVDFLVVALAGGPDTVELIDAGTIAALGPQAVIVNISRGSTIDENAMILALQNGSIAGAALDVFLNEPDVDQRFFDLENVLLQPHVASATHETRQAMGQLMLDNLIAAREGASLLTKVN